jgi:hypothetical protein
MRPVSGEIPGTSRYIFFALHLARQTQAGMGNRIAPAAVGAAEALASPQPSKMPNGTR